jgi:hypothetical protein
VTAAGFVTMHELIRPAFDRGYAVPSFCAWNVEVMKLSSGPRSACTRR